MQSTYLSREEPIGLGNKFNNLVMARVGVHDPRIGVRIHGEPHCGPGELLPSVELRRNRISVVASRLLIQYID
jgi:hypothetical protein